jgi:hypothetical protein
MDAEGGHLIFVSYSSKHRDLTRVLAEAIETQYGAGSVWWDHALESWGDYEVQIRNALNQARVIVVIWTPAAAASDWVKAEAGRANHAHKLVNVRAPGTSWQELPSPYDQHHVKELTDTPGILRSIDAVWTGRAIRTALPLDEIYFRQHGQRIIDSKQDPLPRRATDLSPIELLQPRFEMVGYLDVTGTQTRLFDWCTADPGGSAARLVHGPGGLGKTRLMISLAARLRTQGWTAGFLTPPDSASEATLKQRRQAFEQRIEHGEDQGLLVVVDYAEARQNEVKALAASMGRRADREARPFRVVLLARSAGDWWSNLHDESIDVQRLFRGVGTEAVRPELPFLSTAGDRRAIFDASLTAFRAVLEAQGAGRPTGTPPRDYLARIESEPEYGRPLALQMAALVWLASTRSSGGASDVADLLRLILGLERNHWRKLLGDLDDERVRDMARGAAQVTAVQGTTTAESTEQLLMADAFYQGRRTARADVDRVRRDLARVYGNAEGGVIALEPDLIGEHHVASVSDDELLEGCLRWIEREHPEKQERRHRAVLTVLQRATHADHGVAVADRATALLDHLVVTHAAMLAAPMFEVIVGTPGRLADVVERRVADLDANALSAVDGALPTRSVSVLDLSMKIAVRRVKLAREALAADDGAEADVNRATNQLARSLNNLGVRLAGLGRGEEALAASQEAVARYRRLADVRPDDFLPDLARSLSNLGSQLSGVGRPEEALAPSQEAARIYRRLAQARPDTFLPDLAGSLTDLGKRWSGRGFPLEALAASQDAVAIYRRLAQANPDAFLPELARSLNSLGIRLSDLGRGGEALAASQEAVAMYRRLAQAHPDAFLPNLAGSLASLSVDLSDLGRGEEALAASREAVAMCRRLAEAHPDAFLPSLAASLSNMSEDLSDLGRGEEALAASREAVAMCRRLAEARPDAFVRDLANSLMVASDAFALLGRSAEAAQSAHQALEALAPFVEDHPEVFGELARAITDDVLTYSEAAGEGPDVTLLDRIAKALGSSPS